MSGHHVNCGQGTNWTCPCTCDDEPSLQTPRKAEPTVESLKAQIEGMMRYVQHHPSCRANDFDYLDKTPCTCGLRSFCNPKGQAHD